MLFSYIVPVYNIEEPFFRKCMESILQQTVKDMEVIIVDDGSTSGIEQVCDEYSAQYDFVSVVHQSNAGLAAARNTGVEHARGEWLVHIDGDDWVDTNLSETLLPYTNHEETDILVFGYKACTEDKTTQFLLKNKQAFDQDFDLLREDAICAVLRANHTFDSIAMNTTWGKAFRRSFVKGHHLTFDVNLRRAQDVVYNLYAFDVAKRVEYVDFAPCNYRLDNESLSRGYNKNTRGRLTLTALAAVKFAKSKGQSAKIDRATESFVASCFKIISNQDFFNDRNPKTLKERARDFKDTLESSPFDTVDYAQKSIARLSGVEKRLLQLRSYYGLYAYYKLTRTLRTWIKKIRS